MGLCAPGCICVCGCVALCAPVCICVCGCVALCVPVCICVCGCVYMCMWLCGSVWPCVALCVYVTNLGGDWARFTQFPLMITRLTIIYEIISPGAAGSSIYV